MLEALVRESLLPTAGAPVTMYRAVLAERRVRAPLREVPRFGVHGASDDAIRAPDTGTFAWNATNDPPSVTA